jgi:hypothetical protein
MVFCDWDKAGMLQYPYRPGLVMQKTIQTPQNLRIHPQLVQQLPTEMSLKSPKFKSAAATRTKMKKEMDEGTGD